MRFNINPAQVQARVMNVWNQRVLLDLSNEILDDCNEYCKEDHGNLIASSHTHSQPEIGLLVWQTSYAKRQYWEIRTSLTPGRTWKWCETAKRKWMSRWQSLADEKFRSGL